MTLARHRGFSPGDKVAIVDGMIRVEWLESELRVMGVVKPGMPSKLNTMSTARSRNKASGDFDLKTAGGGYELVGLGTVHKEIINKAGGAVGIQARRWQVVTDKDIVEIKDSDQLLPIAEWELLLATKGLQE